VAKVLIKAVAAATIAIPATVRRRWIRRPRRIAMPARSAAGDGGGSCRDIDSRSARSNSSEVTV
jgi:hypothetical protein